VARSSSAYELGERGPNAPAPNSYGRVKLHRGVEPPSPLTKEMKRSGQDETSPLTGSLFVFQTLQNTRVTELEPKRQNRSDDEHDGGNPEGWPGHTRCLSSFGPVVVGALATVRARELARQSLENQIFPVLANTNHLQTLSAALVEKQEAGIVLW
jgi:hypothetical protein